MPVPPHPTEPPGAAGEPEPPEPQPEHPEQLTEALRLLPRAQHGRAAVTRRALPHVLLAQHLVREDQVLLRIPAGQIEPRLLDGTVLAYHAHSSPEWAEDAPGVQLVGTVTTVRPTADERAAFPRPERRRPAEAEDRRSPRRPPGPDEPDAAEGSEGADAAEGSDTAEGAEGAADSEGAPVGDPDGTLYARLAPILAAVRHPV